MPRWLRALPLALLLALALPLRAQDAQVLRPGDRVRITVWRNAELSGTYTVGPSGEIQHPLYRAVVVAGLPAAGVEERLRTFLRTFDANPEFLVEPLYPVTLTGEVVAPARIEAPPGHTLSRAIEQAGGITAQGRLDRVVLTRGGVRTRVSLRDPGPAGAGMLLRSGDQVRVEEKGRGLRTAARVGSYLLSMSTFFLTVYQVVRN
ncbi:MAG: polysaccharide biosynthesis/export family protein [Gemmatimonadetes bacterium]|nr:polysaccharide biosynthesis/export family protein [Gemmatimonadota bacterium]